MLRRLRQAAGEWQAQGRRVDLRWPRRRLEAGRGGDRPAPGGGSRRADAVVPDMANCSGCESTKGLEGIGEQTLPVGSFPANGFGLHDTAGNVWEWVQDCWHDSYVGAPPKDGSAWEEKADGHCGRRVVRGGSWNLDPEYLRSAFRYRFGAVFRYRSIGFRLAQDL